MATTDVSAHRSHQAYQILHLGFTIAPILAGLDKFFNVLADWEKYLAPIFPQMLGLSPETFMMIVGAIEIVAGIVVWVKPRFGGYLVMAWLWGIILNLLLIPGYFDIALRDFGLSLGALALARLAEAEAPVHAADRVRTAHA
jgi:hypothetical protein